MKGLLLVLVFLISTVGNAAADIKIGVVDMQKALQTVELGKKAKSSLESDFNKKKKELQKEEEEIVKMRDEFQKQSLVMNEKARQKKQGDIQQRIMAFQEVTAKSQMEIQKREAELTKPIVEKIRAIISDLANQKGYSVVLEKNENSVLFSQDKDDLTTEVISTFNNKHKG